MGKVEKIEQDIEKLDKNELNSLREWLHKYDSQFWDDQIKLDGKSGKLDQLAEEALNEYQAGKATEI